MICGFEQGCVFEPRLRSPQLAVITDAQRDFGPIAVGKARRRPSLRRAHSESGGAPIAGNDVGRDILRQPVRNVFPLRTKLQGMGERAVGSRKGDDLAVGVEAQGGMQTTRSADVRAGRQDHKIFARHQRNRGKGPLGRFVEVVRKGPSQEIDGFRPGVEDFDPIGCVAGPLGERRGVFAMISVIRTTCGGGVVMSTMSSGALSGGENTSDAEKTSRAAASSPVSDVSGREATISGSTGTSSESPSDKAEKSAESGNVPASGGGTNGVRSAIGASMDGTASDAAGDSEALHPARTRKRISVDSQILRERGLSCKNLMQTTLSPHSTTFGNVANGVR